MLAAGVVDAVSIASPIGMHYAQGMLAMEHGVHCHFNKTMTTTVDEANRLIDAARAGATNGEMMVPMRAAFGWFVAE